MDSHEYVLYYPHNYIYTSLFTLSIVVVNYALDYKDKIPISLEGLGADFNRFNEYNAVGYCNQECVDKNSSCGIGEHSSKELLLNRI